MKKISLLILMLIFLLIPTCVNANSVSYEDFALEVEKATGLNFTEILNSNNLYSTFINDFNNCTSFGLFGDFGFASTSPTVVGAENMWVVFNTDGSNTVNFTSTASGQVAYTLGTSNRYATKYQLFVDTEKLTRTTYTQSSLFSYNLDEQINWSQTNFLSETGMTYFLDTAYTLSWNLTANCNYYNLVDGSYVRVNKEVELDSLSDTDFPWEDDNSGGSTSGDISYNYDFIGPMSQPTLFKLTDLSFMGSNSGDGIFGIRILTGDTNKYPINELFLDLEVYEVSQSYQVKLVNTYKNYFGNYLNAENFISKSVGQNDTTYTYNLIDTFNREFLSSYFESIETYSFTIKLYDKNYNVLSRIDLIYFGIDNNLNNFENLEDYYNPPYNNGDLNLNTDFDDLISLFTSFMSTIMGFLSIFPLWMNSLIGLGITVAIILRIGGR